MKKLRCAIQKKYKNQAGMNLAPPPPSRNSHAVRWHCTAIIIFKPTSTKLQAEKTRLDIIIIIIIIIEVMDASIYH